MIFKIFADLIFIAYPAWLAVKIGVSYFQQRFARIILYALAKWADDFLKVMCLI